LTKGHISALDFHGGKFNMTLWLYQQTSTYSHTYTPCCLVPGIQCSNVFARWCQ